MPCLRAWVRAKSTDRRAPGIDPEFCRMVDVPFHRGGLEERLGRNAATVEAGAAQCIHFHQGHVEPGGCSVEGRGVPAWAPADHYDVELITHRPAR